MKPEAPVGYDAGSFFVPITLFQEAPTGMSILDLTSMTRRQWLVFCRMAERMGIRRYRQTLRQWRGNQRKSSVKLHLTFEVSGQVGWLDDERLDSVDMGFS